MLAFTRLIAVCCLIVSGVSAFGQTDSVYDNYLKNGSIKYGVLFTSHNLVNKNSDGANRYRINVELPEEAIIYFRSKDSAYWITHLTDTASDWATNLIMYFLTKRDASAFYALYINRSAWLPYKKSDIRDWREKLQKKDRL
jgi:hypothetical protein